MIRPRQKGYKDLPKNLYFDKTRKSYSYIHPQTKKKHYMGSNRTQAIQAANQLNSILMNEQNLVDKILDRGLKIKDFIQDRFEKILTEKLEDKKLSQITYDTYKKQLENIIKKLGAHLINMTTVKMIADFLNGMPAINSNRYRSLLIQLFKYAIAEGAIDENPAEKTIKRPEKKTRTRLSKTVFDAIYQHKETPQFLKNAMDLALLTLQRREEVVRFKFSDIKIENDQEYLYVIQQKTEKHGDAAHIKILMGNELKKVVQRCKDMTLSPYIIHRLPERLAPSKVRKHNTQVLPGYLTRAFATARDKTGLCDHMAARERPTFHEIRSLGIKLYEDKGLDPNNLAGHMTEEMRKHYRKGHGIQWTEAVSF